MATNPNWWANISQPWINPGDIATWHPYPTLPPVTTTGYTITFVMVKPGMPDGDSVSIFAKYAPGHWSLPIPRSGEIVMLPQPDSDTRPYIVHDVAYKPNDKEIVISIGLPK